eukprot:TRINITY_DN3073_c0_g1_i1.p1 TRINITY_DN3073_c0_g1~~TRINITY_DN3073_c0_g1_i1.p1  ORF type:complete len:323 (+),score=13.68 TRINITY_DN3073_c0_g1_i1:40-1008(+)
MELPFEIWGYVFSFFSRDCRQLGKFAMVCRAWNVLSWKQCRSVDLRTNFNLISDEFLVCLTQKIKPNLKEIWISNTSKKGGNLIRKIQEVSIGTLIFNCPRLVSLNLYQCESLTTRAFIRLTQAPFPLRKLTLSGCPKLKDDMLQSILYAFPLLETLDISCNRQITDKTLVNISAHPDLSKNLRKLALWGCYKIGKLELLEVSTLRSISIKGMKGVKEHGFMQVLKQNSECIEVINFNFCNTHLLDRNSMMQMLGMCARLTKFRAKGCLTCTDAVLQAGIPEGVRVLDLQGTPLTDRGFNRNCIFLPAAARIGFKRCESDWF